MKVSFLFAIRLLPVRSVPAMVLALLYVTLAVFRIMSTVVSPSGCRFRSPRPFAKRFAVGIVSNKSSVELSFSVGFIFLVAIESQLGGKNFAYDALLLQRLHNPPTSSLTTLILNPLSAAISSFNFSNDELAYSMIAPHRKQAM